MEKGSVESASWKALSQKPLCVCTGSVAPLRKHSVLQSRKTLSFCSWVDMDGHSITYRMCQL